MALRFQHLVDGEINFRVDTRLLTTEEISYLTSHLNNSENYLRYMYMLYGIGFPPKALYTDSTIYFEGTSEDNAEYTLFVPTTEKPLSNKRIFEMFLKKHRAYSAFKREVAMQCSENTYEIIVQSKRVHQTINLSLSWASTSGRTPHWQPLHQKWMAMARDLNLNNRQD